MQFIIDISSYWVAIYIIASIDEPIALVYVLNFIVFSVLFDLYKRAGTDFFYVEIATLLKVAFSSLVFIYCFQIYFDYISVASNYMNTFFLFVFIAIIGRFCFRMTLKYIRLRGYNNKNVIFVGLNSSSKKIAIDMSIKKWLGFNVLGYYEYDAVFREDISFKYFGDVNDFISDLSSSKLISADIVYLSFMESEKIRPILEELADTTLTVKLVPDAFLKNIYEATSQVFNNQDVLSLFDSRINGLNKLLKNFEDKILSVCIIFIISPLLLIIALAVKLSSPGPIIFKQARYGLDGKIINIYKFRSMMVMENKNIITQATSNDIRVTKVGRFLRRSSLDELPQFFNVLQGKMSIVGPRPHAVAHNEEYRKLIKGYMLRHKVKPGITGWAQINGYRGETDTLDKMAKRIEYDIFYIKNWSLTFDFKIIILTIFKGFFNKNAY